MLSSGQYKRNQGLFPGEDGVPIQEEVFLNRHFLKE